jgi:hypothetical protein
MPKLACAWKRHFESEHRSEYWQSNGDCPQKTWMVSRSFLFASSELPRPWQLFGKAPKPKDTNTKAQHGNRRKVLVGRLRAQKRKEKNEA